MIRQEQFIDMIDQFLGHPGDPDTFCDGFTALWMRHRDEKEEVARTWLRPYDAELLDVLKRGEVTTAEFENRWTSLWGGSITWNVQGMIDRIHSACSVYSPEPTATWQIDAAQFRLEVEKELGDLRRSA